MEIVFTDNAKADLRYWRESNNLAIQSRISQLIESIRQDPFKGIGKPEALKHHLSGTWSRRITREHRMVYIVSNNLVTIISLRHHY